MADRKIMIWLLASAAVLAVAVVNEFSQPGGEPDSPQLPVSKDPIRAYPINVEYENGDPAVGIRVYLSSSTPDELFAHFRILNMDRPVTDESGYAEPIPNWTWESTLREKPRLLGVARGDVGRVRSEKENIYGWAWAYPKNNHGDATLIILDKPLPLGDE